MRSALFLAVFAVAAARGGCDPTEPPYDPCAAKSCGDACLLCPPDDAECAETAVVKACDTAGACVQAPVDCAPLPYDPCAAKRACDGCTLCPPDALDCVETAVLKECDASGRCVESTGQCTPPPYDPCAGKGCGEYCDPCIPGEVCPMYFAATACDPFGRCVTAGTFTCEPPPPPTDPCAGKRCGDPCSTCSPTTEILCPAVMMYCDGAGACGYASPVCE